MGVSVRANTLPINRDFPLPRARPPASSSHGFYVLVTYLRVTYRDGEGGGEGRNADGAEAKVREGTGGGGALSRGAARGESQRRPRN